MVESASPESAEQSLEAFQQAKKDTTAGNPKGLVAGSAGTGVAATLAAPAAISAAGYTSSGIAGGSLAASIMSAEAVSSGGGVVAGGLTATLQSAGACGMGLGLGAAVFATGAVIGLGAVALLSAGKRRGIVIGEQGSASHISHGNVIALHSEEHNRFVRLYKDSVDGHGGTKDAEKLPLHWESEQFLVVHVGGGSFYAFYSVPDRRYICFDLDDNKFHPGFEKSLHDPVDASEEFFVQNIDGSSVVLFPASLLNQSTMQMDSDGTVSVSDMTEDDIEPSSLFSVVLLMEAPHDAGMDAK